MSSLAAAEKKKAADRKQAAMRMNYTKVKPTVVKHVLQDQVIHLRSPEVSTILTSFSSLSRNVSLTMSSMLIAYRRTQINST